MATRSMPRHSRRCTPPRASGSEEGLGPPAHLAKPLARLPSHSPRGRARANALNELLLQWMSSRETAREMDTEIGKLEGDILGGGKPLLTYLRHDDRFDDAGLKAKLISEPGPALRAFRSNPWLSWDARKVDRRAISPTTSYPFWFSGRRSSRLATYPIIGVRLVAQLQPLAPKTPSRSYSSSR